jgi:hypothetical protein
MEATTAPAAALRAKLGFVTEQEVAQLFGITVLTARNRQRLGNFPAVYKVGHERLYRAAEVEAWIRRCRVAKAAA